MARAKPISKSAPAKPVRLTRDFFDAATVTVAKNLLGKLLSFNGHFGLIMETEAYVGENDPACHAARGMTKRNAVMYGPPGHTYVYLIYGLYHCLNFVTEENGKPAAVLIRGLYMPKTDLWLDGPGKLCRHLGITRDHTAMDLCGNDPLAMRVIDTGLRPKFDKTPRIGIRQGTDKLWRFVVNSKI